MLTAHSLRKSFGPELILDNVSFSLSGGERIGLVGPNGCGKTTLLRLLARLDAPDSGAVQWSPPDLRVGCLPQGVTFAPDETLADFLVGVAGGLPALSAALERAAEDLAHSPQHAAAQSAYEAALARLTLASEVAERAPGFLAALGLASLPTESPVAALSGGQKTRLALARVLITNPQLLLLDEPTNHLDIAMLEWLETWLTAFRGAALIVSHDRAFLDAAVTRLLELDPVTHTTREYAGNYSDYVEEKLAEQERQRGAWRDQQEEIRRLRQDIARTKEQSLRVERSTTPRQPGVRRIAKKVARKALAREKKLERYLESDERLEKPKAGWQMKLEFGETPTSGQAVLVTEKLSVGYGGNALLRDLDLHLRRGARAVLVGPNGAGKTTLLRTIAGRLPPLAGRVRLGANVRLGYMAQEQELLDPRLDAFTTIRQFASFSETEARSFLHYFLFEDDEVFTPVGSLSFGERARLMLAGLVAQGCNFLLLDEPINHLDIPSRARFEQALAAFEGTTLAVVHDRYFIERFATEMWEVAEGAIRRENPIQ
jgi:ATPase subunit of ABC transporter with duplicated ATPase domains